MVPECLLPSRLELASVVADLSTLGEMPSDSEATVRTLQIACGTVLLS